MNPLLTVINVAFIIVDITFIGLFVYAFVKSLHYRPNFNLGKKKAKRILRLREAVVEERWKVILEKFSKGTPDAWQAAVVEADSLVSTTLKDLGIRGEHLVDRIANLETDELESEDEVLTAHRMRTELEGRPVGTLSADDARFAIRAYEAFLRELGLLK